MEVPTTAPASRSNKDADDSQKNNDDDDSFLSNVLNQTETEIEEEIAGKEAKEIRQVKYIAIIVLIISIIGALLVYFQHRISEKIVFEAQYNNDAMKVNDRYIK
jgi:hypothetical protein